MNVEGTGPYDFTCDDSHHCYPCRKIIRDTRNEIQNRAVSS